jgi:hypothetical protein
MLSNVVTLVSTFLIVGFLVRFTKQMFLHRYVGLVFEALAAGPLLLVLFLGLLSVFSGTPAEIVAANYATSTNAALCSLIVLLCTAAGRLSSAARAIFGPHLNQKHPRIYGPSTEKALSNRYRHGKLPRSANAA